MQDMERSTADSLHVGDTVTVRFRVSGPNAINKLPELRATILSIEDDLVRIRYADDAPLYAGVVGLVRLPRRPG
jgi:hypothetical protein